MAQKMQFHGFTLLKKTMNPQNESGKLGLSTCITLLIGVMVGSAIFSLSGLTILMAGPAAMLSWFLAGGIMLGYGLLTGELACRFPKSGGVYFFPRCAFEGKKGVYLGSLSCWCSIITNIVAVAFSAIYVGLYLSVAFSWAAEWQTLIAILSIAYCFVINVLKVEWAGKINAVIVVILILTILVYISIALSGGTYSSQMLVPFFQQGKDGALGFVWAIPTAIIGYSGIVSLSFLASQVKNPRRNIPVAMTVATGCVIVLYVLIIIATVGLVSAQYLADNPKMQFIPLFAACFSKLTTMPWLTKVISLSAVMALLTTMMTCVTMNAWTLKAASHDGIFPPFLGRLTKNGIPVYCVALTCLITMVYACFPHYTQVLVNLGAIFNIITMVLTLLSLIKARQNDSGTLHFRAPGGRAMPYVMLTILVVCNLSSIINGGMSIWIYTLACLGVGVLIFYCRKKHIQR